MNRLEQRYEGKAKKVFATDDPHLFVVEYKDDATAFNAQKRGVVRGKGALNNAVSARLFEVLGARGVPTHFVETLSEQAQLVRAVSIIPVEVIVRNVAAGSFAKRYGVPEGGELSPRVVEWCYKSDELGDPPMNSLTAVALGFATEEALETLYEMSLKINSVLATLFRRARVETRGLQARVRAHTLGRDHPSGRDQPRHLPLVGRRERRKAR